TDLFVGDQTRAGAFTRNTVGDAVTYVSFPGIGGTGGVPNVLLVNTDARTFAGTGSIELNAVDEFGVEPPQSTQLLPGQQRLPGTFQPSSFGAAIPLPAALPASGMLLALAGLARWRRWRRSRAV